MRGIAFADPWAPVVLLNSKDSLGARVFTLAHELAHLWIGTTGISNLEPLFGPRTSIQRTEQFCNAVAAEVVAPRSSVDSLWKATDPSSDRDDRIRSVAAQLRVSREVIARRLLDSETISRKEYLLLRERYKEEWQHELDRRTANDKGRGPSYATQVVAKNGRALIRMAVAAHGAGETTGREVSAVLGVKLNNLDSVLAKVG